MDQTEVVLVVPNCPTQPWYNSFYEIPRTISGDPTQRKSTCTTKARGETNTSDREGVREVFLSQDFYNDTVDILTANLRNGNFSNQVLFIFEQMV